jgi:hypothetical protein
MIFAVHFVEKSMKKLLPRKCLYLRPLVFFLVLCMAALPLIPTLLLASETEVVPVVLEAEGKKEAVVESDVTEPEAPVLSDQKKAMAADTTVESTETTTSRKPRTTKQEGMSTLTKVGIGVGVAAVVGVALALGGGSSDDGPKYATLEGMVGPWSAQAKSVDGRTYTGVYTFYLGGSHTYDITISDGEVKRGRGNWRLDSLTGALSVENDTGTVYSGNFLEQNFSIIILSSNDGRWRLTLSKM